MEGEVVQSRQDPIAHLFRLMDEFDGAGNHWRHQDLYTFLQAMAAWLEGGAVSPRGVGRLWLNDGSCVRLRPAHKDHVWSYDFMAARTTDGRAFRLLTVIDEYPRECLAIDVDRTLTADHVLDRLCHLFALRGRPAYIRSDNGPEFTARAVRGWLGGLGVGPLFIEPGSPWENGYVESFNGKVRDEVLNPEAFDTLPEARVLIERWRREYNAFRCHACPELGNLGRHLAP